MAGYTPLFDGLLDGTLHGKWPVNGLWVLMLSQCDKNGDIDMVPQALASRIGCPVDVLMNAIVELMAPDPDSRTQECEGRRLVLIDSRRSWGWHVVNHVAYREKARLAAKNARDVELGKEAERKRAARAAVSASLEDSPPKSAAVRHGPPVSASQTQTQIQTQTKEQEGNGALPHNLNASAWDQWEAYKRKQFGMSYKSPRSKALAQKRLAELGSPDYQQQCVDHSMALQWKGIFQPNQTGKGESFMETQARLLAAEDVDND